MSNIFSINLRKYRQQKGLNQKQLAELLSIETNSKFTARNISSYEASNVYPKGDIFPALARILDVSIDELFSLNSKKESIDLSEIIGVTRPQLDKLSKSDQRMVFEKYLSYLDEVIKSKELLLEKIHKLEAYIRELEGKAEELKDNKE